VSAQLCPPQPILIEQVHFSSPSKAKVGDTARKNDSSKEHSAGRPDIYTIAAAAVDVAVHIAFDAVRDTVIGKSEKAAVRKEWFAMSCDYIEGVSRS
jgi:hypothetical protein